MYMRVALSQCMVIGALFGFLNALATAEDAHPVLHAPPTTSQTYEEVMETATAHFTFGEYEEAEKELRKVFFMKGHSTDARAVELLQRVRRAMANETALETGENYYNSRNYSEAAAELRLAQNDPRAQRLLNRVDSMQVQYDATLAEIQEAMEKGDSSFLYSSKLRQYKTVAAAAGQALNVYKGDPQLEQLKKRAEKEIKDLETEKAEADTASKKSSQEQREKIDKGMNRWLDKLF